MRPSRRFIAVKWIAALSCLGLTLYPIIIYPMFNNSYYKSVQKETRKGIDIEAIQPANMKVWSDPFGRK